MLKFLKHYCVNKDSRCQIESNDFDFKIIIIKQFKHLTKNYPDVWKGKSRIARHEMPGFI
jgi:hypothetical protein